MTSLPWGWLANATAPETRDDVELEPSERIAFWAMAHNFSDDVVPCILYAEGCQSPARWAHRCSGCGHEATGCDAHRVRVDVAAQAMRRVKCTHCSEPVPVPIPWLPL